MRSAEEREGVACKWGWRERERELHMFLFPSPEDSDVGGLLDTWKKERNRDMAEVVLSCSL
jgi:hypothetical protein